MNGDKPRLTAEQKKRNHIESEKKRREAIRDGFERLSEIVPDCEGQARSENVVLSNTVKYLREQVELKNEMKKQALAKGMSEGDFEQTYRDVEQALRQADASRNAGGTASSPESESR